MTPLWRIAWLMPPLCDLCICRCKCKCPIELLSDEIEEMAVIRDITFFDHLVIGKTTLSGEGCVFPYTPHPQPHISNVRRLTLLIAEVSGRGENTKCSAEKRLFPARKFESTV